jgi:hypothetical protein
MQKNRSKIVINTLLYSALTFSVIPCVSQECKDLQSGSKQAYSHNLRWGINYDLKWGGIAVQVNNPYVTFECGNGAGKIDSYIAVQNSIIYWGTDDDSTKLEKITFYRNWEGTKLNIPVGEDKKGLDYQAKIDLLNNNPGIKEKIFYHLSRINRIPSLRLF